MIQDYVLYNNRRKRKKTEFIILTQIRNLIEKGFPVEPLMYHRNNYLTFPYFEYYWMKNLKKDTIPCHYYVDPIGKDCYIFKGLCEFQPSCFLEDLVSASVIKYEYKNAILIVLADDYTKNNVDDRMSEQLSQKLLSDLMYRYDIPENKVLYIDDCLTDSWKDMLLSSTLTYQYELGSFYDHQFILKNIRKFKKY